MALRAVLFDFDGLLVDTESAWFAEWERLFADHGLTLTPQIWSRIVGSVAVDPLAELERELGRSVDPALGRAADSRAEAGGRTLGLRPGAEQLIEAIDRAGLQRAIVSSSPSIWIDEHLTRLHCDGWAAIVSAEGRPERSKPNPTLYVEALQLLDIEPPEALVLEDSTNGIRAAKAAGIRCIAVPNSVTQHFDLTEADAVLDSLAAVHVQ